MIEGLRCTVLSLKAQYKDAMQKKRGQFLKKGTNGTNWHIKKYHLMVPCTAIFQEVISSILCLLRQIQILRHRARLPGNLQVVRQFLHCSIHGIKKLVHGQIGFADVFQ